MKLALRVKSHERSFRALLVADGNRPPPVADLAMPGWVCIAKTVGAAVTFGALPLPVRDDGKVVAHLVEVELRGDDWWGRVEVIDAAALLPPPVMPEVVTAPQPSCTKQNRVQRRADDAKKRKAKS